MQNSSELMQALIRIQERTSEFFFGLERIPEKLRSALEDLAKLGWFLDAEMTFPFIGKLGKLLKNKRVEDAENALIDYFRENLSIIARKLEADYPNRSAPVSAAITAHERCEYYLSIPVFLAQSEGIFRELMQRLLFSDKDKDEGKLFSDKVRKEAIAKCIENIQDASDVEPLLYPLTCSLPISASQKQRGQDFNALNRHQVLHGEISDYGSEINSLKAISFLNHIASVVGQIREEEKAAEHEPNCFR